ncbi:hypothetical protein QTP70_007274 [Hemibagrus guttatus]|uniref:adenine phosphoribosyltransferase n=1 Tax=Hemibagrus guttatus TaxID=175788 RepID=A0AAE0UZ62_9TELE|nr:hypothetical protein QTP70_007274 [Hemibagrus guttatus]
MNELAVPQKSDEGWYLSLMAPNTKGPNFAWLDPSRLYCNSQYKRHLSTASNSQTPNSTMAKTKELSKDTRNKIVDLHQAGKTESAIGLRVLIVDQWIETGGTMKAAIKLVEKQGASVVGVAAVAIENSEGGKWIKENYKHSHCIPKNLQPQIDSQYVESFKHFKQTITE